MVRGPWSVLVSSSSAFGKARDAATSTGHGPLTTDHYRIFNTNVNSAGAFVRLATR